MDEQISGWMNEGINIYWSQDFKLLESKSLAHSSRSRWQVPGTCMADITKRCLFSFLLSPDWPQNPSQHNIADETNHHPLLILHFFPKNLPHSLVLLNKNALTQIRSPPWASPVPGTLIHICVLNEGSLLLHPLPCQSSLCPSSDEC